MNGLASVFDAHGAQAAQIATLGWVLVIGATIIMLMVGGALWLAMTGGDRTRRMLGGDRAVTLLGIVFPVVTLTALLHYSFVLMRDDAPGEAPAELAVTGEQYWWRVSYGGNVASANELRIPVGRRTMLQLASPDVIHSFWAPSLAGKIDLIPGRTTSLMLMPERPGIFRGACAEFCGTGHAFMAFNVIAMPAADYEAWRVQETGPAIPPSTALARQGAELFQRAGCGACHAIRGTSAAGSIGPDLTHFGSRTTIGAGTLAMSEANIASFVANTDRHKPGNAMPPFRIFSPDEMDALAAFLFGLK